MKDEKINTFLSQSELANLLENLYEKCMDLVICEISEFSFELNLNPNDYLKLLGFYIERSNEILDNGREELKATYASEQSAFEQDNEH